MTSLRFKARQIEREMDFNDWPDWQENAKRCWEEAIKWCAEKHSKGEFVSFGQKKQGDGQ